ncbi:sensor histidine kinase KdpD [Planomicrobium sp. YIM 101495]|uniref:sensor histidine kinase n=1 Tax=Planomicrobium sp. YIM 101495 TaxID=2665160 RepID=UPI0012B9D565|nr:histidine kinase dimerization/phospho-acceptor domain-containing protein [Planomicrobium sp. YIM 101495]MTD30946.1 sensor histidine kinase [Planomicrobium sp. YIM 101495]
MKKWIWLTTASLVIVMLWSVLQLGPQYIGKSFLETGNFSSEHENFKSQLVHLELAPPELAETPITAADIKQFRDREASLAERIRMIQENYEGDIQEAADTGNEDLETTLTEQRESEITAAKAFFQDDELVREQIQAEREAKVADIMQQVKAERPVFFENYPYYAYQLTNIETGEVFTRGELDDRPVYEETFTADRPLRSNGQVYESYEEEDYIQSEAEFEGQIQITSTELADSLYANDFQAFNLTKSLLYAFIVLSVIGVVVLLMKLPFKWNWFTGNKFYVTWQNWPIEIRLAALLLTVYLLQVAVMAKFFNVFRYMMYGELWINFLSGVWLLVFALAVTAIALLQMLWLAELYRTEGKLAEDLQNSYTWNLIKIARFAFLKKSIGIQMLCLLVIVFFWGFGTMLLVNIPPGIILWIPASLFIGLPALLLFLQRFGYLNLLMKRTEAMAEGRLEQEIPVQGRSPLADHARHLSKLKEGVRQSLSEQAKSERLKTELITNVSHDLRTPLTSIITYTDLMKAPDLTTEERLAYAEVLERKADRLKNLIEDLFEVSKMASGNLELERRRVDYTQLMVQAFAEHAEVMESSGLDFRVNAPDHPLFILVDGQKWWRVLDNLIVNAVKYALPGTRVYANLNEVDGQAVFVIKNVTKYELGENTDELFERFKRGDTARQTEGSGLGLAIAQSIVELHEGTLKIEVDGDLFKVTVKVDCMK